MFSRNDNMSFWDQRLCPPFRRKNPEEFGVLFSDWKWQQIWIKSLVFGHLHDEFFTSWFFKYQERLFQTFVRLLFYYYFALLQWLRVYGRNSVVRGLRNRKIILASQADETDHKENKKDFLSFCIETFWTSKICVQTSNYPTQF